MQEISIKNRWLDEEDRVYIVFKVEEIYVKNFMIRQDGSDESNRNADIS